MNYELRATDSWDGAPDFLHLAENEVHVWRIQLDNPGAEPKCGAVLSVAEQTRARRLYSPIHGRRYTVAHGALRRILAGYTGMVPEALNFNTEVHGKPQLSQRQGTPWSSLQFNLSHSGGIGLVAVSNQGPVGVDVEAWRANVLHLELAERFFSDAECTVLRALAGDPDGLRRGFFSAWTRKEAYIKATGHGITRGLHHFDVAVEPDRPAAILEDRLDPAAASRWSMANITVGDRYSAAVVALAPLTNVRLFDATSL